MGNRILVADDNPVNRHILRAIMERAGFLVDTVSSGAEAAKACAQHRYGAVLMDLEMPGMDGYMTALSIREQERGSRRTPIIALTAQDSPEARVLSAAAGMDDFQTKPADAANLTFVVKRWLQRSPERVPA